LKINRHLIIGAYFAELKFKSVQVTHFYNKRYIYQNLKIKNRIKNEYRLDIKKTYN